ncbi:sodium:solute symporter family transporter [Parapedobacter sp. 10938]|uniref:sodium:solute symporter family transporter n=1 Tax=Parapedobacter flavus TaxID=3110225 RepID=UPI002DBAEE1F|nr:sodium/solute symporter [Parapedobacter sp. 10938]MEC3878971.1 sodium/solute symporter [Parapedobacter sp. 10938]
MHKIDYIILITYFVGVLALAGFFSKSQKSLKDFFMASGNIPWWAAAFSGIATVASAISYIGGVGLGFSHDFSFLQYRLALPIAIAVICIIVLPFFYNLKLYSIYEYLEKRFNLAIRLLGSGLFILFKCCFLAIGIYAPAIIISVLTGFDIILIVLLTGVLTTLYTLMGGMKAVIWTDVPQLIIMLGGIFVIIGVGVAGVDGGFAEVMNIGREHNKFDYFNFSPKLTDTYTIWSGIIGGTFLIISQFGTDQSEMQRFLTVNSLRKSNIALITSVLFATLLGFLIFFEGSVLYAFYEQRGQADIATNEVFIRFVIEELPVGVRGFLIAALFAAAMSTISSVLNSLTTVFLSDFYNRFKEKEATVTLARVVTMAIGFFSTLLACLGGYLGNVLEAATTVINFFGGALVGVFLLGMINRKAGAKGALIGFLGGFVAVSMIAGLTDVSFMWYSAIGGTTTYILGSLVSFVLKERLRPDQSLLVYQRKKKSKV